MIQNYKQTTYETCLAVSLLQAVDKVKPIIISQKLELDCINYSMKFSRDDFVIGHLDFMAIKFNVKIKRIIDSILFYNYLKKIKSSSKTNMEVEKVNLNLVDKMLKDKPILYIDAFYLFKVYHYPHFITVLDKIDSKYKIYDTWDGQEKIISAKILAKSISSLRNHLKMCPQILLVSTNI